MRHRSTPGWINAAPLGLLQRIKKPAWAGSALAGFSFLANGSIPARPDEDCSSNGAVPPEDCSSGEYQIDLATVVSTASTYRSEVSPPSDRF